MFLKVKINAGHQQFKRLILDMFSYYLRDIRYCDESRYVSVTYYFPIEDTSTLVITQYSTVFLPLLTSPVPSILVHVRPS